jgi:hypothetical protein
MNEESVKNAMQDFLLTKKPMDRFDGVFSLSQNTCVAHVYIMEHAGLTGLVVLKQEGDKNTQPCDDTNERRRCE